MSVFISDFKAAAPNWTYAHDDAPGGSHGGTLAATDVTFGMKVDGTPDFRTAIISCPFPGCGSTSYHPIGGGAQPRSVQELFVRMVIRLGCPCGLLTAGKTPLVAISHLRGHVTVLEGQTRWQIASIVP
jgi:hypothetical protein